MCMGANVDRFLRDYHQSQSEICVNPCTTPTFWRGAAGKNGTLIFARNLEDSEINLARGPDGEPSWGKWFHVGFYDFSSADGDSHHEWSYDTRIRTSYSNQ